jgi:hypothetical protein
MRHGRRVVWYINCTVWNEPVVFIFTLEAAGNRFLWNVSINLPNYTTPHRRGPQFNLDTHRCENIKRHTNLIIIVIAETNYQPAFLILKQEVLVRANRLLSLIRHEPHWKRRVQQFFYCCVSIRYRGNVSTERLPSNERGIFTEPFPSKDKGTCTEPLPSNDREDTHTHACTHTDSNVIS